MKSKIDLSKKRRHSFIPSLGISVTDKCDMKCIYCPPYGENIVECKSLCKIESITYLIGIAKINGVQVVRITGGEPLLEQRRTEGILKSAVENEIYKIVLNTNGTNLSDSIKWLRNYRDSFVLKISLDSLKKEVFEEITKSNQYENVMNGITKAREEGFNIEINTVANKICPISTALLRFLKHLYITCNVRWVNKDCAIE